MLKKKYNCLWIGKTGEANAWYHITLLSQADRIADLYVVRHKKPGRPIETEKDLYFIESGTSKSFLFETFKLYLSGIWVLVSKRVDFIVTFNVFPYGIISYFFARLFRKKLMLCFIGADYNTYFMKTKWKCVIRSALKYAAVVICKGRHMEPGLIASGIDQKKIFFYPHFVDEKFLQLKVDRQKAEYDIINISEMIPRKNLVILLLALSRFKENGNPLTACFVGTGPLLDDLKEKVKELNLEQYVTFSEYQTDVVSVLKRARLYVQTSRGEGLSLALLEAFTSGLIPIATEAGSERDIINDGVNGRIIAIDSVDDLVVAIEEMLDVAKSAMVRANIANDRKRFSLASAKNGINNIMETFDDL